MAARIRLASAFVTLASTLVFATPAQAAGNETTVVPVSDGKISASCAFTVLRRVSSSEFPDGAVRAKLVSKASEIKPRPFASRTIESTQITCESVPVGFGYFPTMKTQVEARNRNVRTTRQVTGMDVQWYQVFTDVRYTLKDGTVQHLSAYQATPN